MMRCTPPAAPTTPCSTLWREAATSGTQPLKSSPLPIRPQLGLGRPGPFGGRLCVQVEEVMSREECGELVELSQQAGFSLAGALSS